MVNSKVKVLSLGIITSLFMSSTPVLAATNFQSNTEKIYNSQVNKISNFKVKKSKVVYNHYTYKTAPQNVRTRYEANCKSINKTPNDSDVISVPQNLDIVKSDCRSVRSRGNNYYVGYDMERSIRVVDDHGNVYFADIYKDYVGYRHQTSGQAVRCLQALLNEIGYHLDVDGIFGSRTHSAIINFQQKHGLPVDATVGPNTWKRMLQADGF